MASNAVQMICVALCAIGLIAVLTCCVLPEWMVLKHDTHPVLGPINILKMTGAMPGVRQLFSSWSCWFRANGGTSTAGLFIQEQHYGLWMECGQSECSQFGSILAATPSGLQAAQATTVMSCILCGLSLLFLIFGADFTTYVQNKNSKSKRIQAAGVGLLLAGLLVIFPVSLWAHNILRNKQCVSRDIGVSIYIGWAAGVLMILTQGLLLSFGRPRSRSSAVPPPEMTVLEEEPPLPLL